MPAVCQCNHEPDLHELPTEESPIGSGECLVCECKTYEEILHSTSVEVWAEGLEAFASAFKRFHECLTALSRLMELDRDLTELEQQRARNLVRRVRELEGEMQTARRA